jgi:phage recombination protein Bet
VSATALPDAARRRGIDESQWATLCSSLFPGARPESVLMVVDYCHARRLDPLKKPCHIVPMEVKDARTGAVSWRDVVLPGIYELRATAQRTNEYLGHAPATWGPEMEFRGVKCFSWCELTIYRWHPSSQTKIEFPVRVYFQEVVQTNREGKVNARWTRAPLQMLLKCTEAAGLREAFPDELGGEHAWEELDGARVEDDQTIDALPLPPKPESFDAWIGELENVADQGELALRAAWKSSPKGCREYLQAADPARWTAIKTHAQLIKPADEKNGSSSSPSTPDAA